MGVTSIFLRIFIVLQFIIQIAGQGRVIVYKFPTKDPFCSGASLILCERARVEELPEDFLVQEKKSRSSNTDFLAEVDDHDYAKFQFRPTSSFDNLKRLFAENPFFSTSIRVVYGQDEEFIRQNRRRGPGPVVRGFECRC
eukprot:TRINITY_DN8165_c0_g1_i2.p2 TRINITY_DN8165_c0_g1~~TRINITY_DN8165_c0_g1_i2.p2  ORF type:complete len:140 (+),score=7.99 TRINITY_DN8165_c0_g1_i2:149-568(+)